MKVSTAFETLKSSTTTKPIVKYQYSYYNNKTLVQSTDINIIYKTLIHWLWVEQLFNPTPDRNNSCLRLDKRAILVNMCIINKNKHKTHENHIINLWSSMVTLQSIYLWKIWLQWDLCTMNGTDPHSLATCSCTYICILVNRNLLDIMEYDWLIEKCLLSYWQYIY